MNDHEAGEFMMEGRQHASAEQIIEIRRTSKWDLVGDNSERVKNSRQFFKETMLNASLCKTMQKKLHKIVSCRSVEEGWELQITHQGQDF